ncbi:MAG: response regulator [Alphaproteobacteria bacterium]|nr:response regulator [Alphaproteobacteria bacterium]MCB9791476.1 response regulator [Alphaproteobacteria bacterium]
MAEPWNIREHPLAVALVAAPVSFAASLPPILLTAFTRPMASVWFANITAALMVLRAPARARWAAGLGAVLGLFVATLASGVSVERAAAFTAVNAIEILVTSALLLRLLGRFPRDPRELLSGLLIATTAGPLLSALVGAAAVHTQMGAPMVAGFVGLFGSFSVSALVVFSAVWTLQVIEADEAIAPWQRAALWGALLGTTALVFSTSTHSLLFLPPVVLVLFGLMGQPRQGALGMLLVAACAVILTHLGYGPITPVEASAYVGRGFLLQVYLLALALFTVPAALHHIRMAQTLQSLRASELAATDASRAKSSFLATMSHELRTPLAGISGYLEFLGDTHLDLAQSHYLGRVESGVQQLHTVIGDILDLSRIESGALQLRPRVVALAALADTCVSLVGGQVSEEVRLRAVIEEATPPFVSVDDRRLQQVLLNLLNNAAKFTEVGSIILQVRPTQGRTGWVEFLVRDTGCGIPATHIARVLDRFQQVEEDRDRAHGGSGLGLSISKQIVEAMGGTLTLTSQAGLGTTVAFQLPLPAAEAPAGMDPSSKVLTRIPTLTPLGLRVLLAEDDVLMGELVTMQLTTLGCEVTHCADPLEAAGLAAEGRFDLLISDLHMPGLDGFALLRRVRRVNESLPAILMTADATAQARQIALAAGFRRILIKPVARRELHAALSDPSVFSDEGGEPIVLLDEDALSELNLVLGGQDLKRTLQNGIDRFEALVEELQGPSVTVERIVAVAHQLRGTSGALSMVAVQGQAALLEEVARAGEDPRPTLLALAEAIQATRAELVSLDLCGPGGRGGERKILPFNGKS